VLSRLRLLFTAYPGLGHVHPMPFVDICPPGLQLLGEPLSTNIQHLRPEDPPVGPDDRVPDGVPDEGVVYVTLGTVVNSLPGVFEAVLEGLAAVDAPLVVTTGPDVDPARLGAQPPHVTVERFIPQGLLLPRCRAVVAHAGAWTMLGALAHGVPQVLLPHGAEQSLNAAACAGAGAAVVVAPERLTAEAVGARSRRPATSTWRRPGACRPRSRRCRPPTERRPRCLVPSG
jgi:UDP:flavonoid glycosyltransferase YjiC (YdhE family)